MTSTNTGRNDLPTAVYAAAGAGEMAYERLRRLPEVAARTLRTASERAEALRHRVRATDPDVAGRLQYVRESTQKGVATLAAQAYAAQERAIIGYRELVSRGEQVVNDRLGGSTWTATQEAGPAKVEVTVGEPERGSASSASGSAGAGQEAARTTATGSDASARGGASARGTVPGGNSRGVGKTGTRTAAKRADA